MTRRLRRIAVPQEASLIAYPTTGHYFPLGKKNSAADVTTIALAINLLRGTPFRVGSARTVTELCLAVETLEAATSARVGVYKANPDTLYPEGLVAQSGVLDCSATGLKTTSGLSAKLEAGAWYWAFTVTNTPGGLVRFRGANNIQALAHFFGRAAYNAADFLSLQVAFTFAALPSVFPSGAVANGTEAPLVFARF